MQYKAKVGVASVSPKRAFVRLRPGFLVSFLLLFAVGCATPKPILVITTGGLGFSQMGNMRHAIEHRCIDADVKSAGAWDAYKNDVVGMIRWSPHRHVVLIGHSLGCQTIASTAAKLPKVDLLVFLEPAWDDITLPKNVARTLWYRRTNFDLIREANIRGMSSPTLIPGGHNDVPNSKIVIEAVIKAINEIHDAK